jgi:hypothetical protein
MVSPAKSFSGPSPAGLMTIFYCHRFEAPQPGVPGPRIYIPQEQGGPVIPPDTGSPFRLLLRLARLRWRYSNPTPHEDECDNVLPAQGYRTTQGVMIDGYGAIVE